MSCNNITNIFFDLRNLFFVDDDVLYKIIIKHDNLDFNFINILGYFKYGIINGDVYDEIIHKYMSIINSDKSVMNKICDIKQLIYYYLFQICLVLL